MNIPLAYAQVRYYFQPNTGGRIAMSQCGFSHDASLTPDEQAEAAFLAFNDVVNQVLTNQAALIRCEVQRGPNPVGPTGAFDDTNAGAIGGAPLTPQVAVLLKKSTALGGRPNRGRMYIPYTGEDLVDGAGRIGSSNVAAINVAIENWLGLMSAAGMEPVVLHETAGDPTPISTILCESVVATQRRRLVRA